MTLKFLGSGTSQGVPVIGCKCEVCTSINPKDQRFRSSALITADNGKKILIDCGPDFRQQMLNNKEAHIDAVMLTHEHNDHVIGLDDLRPLIFKNKADMPIYCTNRVANEIKDRFAYAFAEVRYPGAPAFEIEIIDEAFNLYDAKITPIKVLHHILPVLGFKFKNSAYITDASFISDEEKDKLFNLDYLVLNCIRREKPHPAHFILPDVLKLNDELKPKKMLLTHISHHFGLHEVSKIDLPTNVSLAYDGLEIEL